MKKKKTIGISVREIADAAGVSKSTVGYVLRNQAGPSKKMRDRVLGIARKLGYVPDARVSSWMATVRGAKAKELLPIAWLNTHPEEDAWHRYEFMSPCLNGVVERCRELGYRVEELWTGHPGMTMRRISQILYQRGIEGVVVTPPVAHIRLKWETLAAVNMGTELLAPRLHRVIPDATFNVLLAIKMLKRFGYRRIGICLSQAIDRATNHVVSSVAHHLASISTDSKLVCPIFYAEEDVPELRKKIVKWMRLHRPDVVVGHDSRLVQWIEEGGYRVPKTVGVVHLALDDDVLEWAGVYSNRKEIGRTTAELVVSLVQNRQFGVPRIALDTVVRGSWRNGRTLLVPKSGK